MNAGRPAGAEPEPSSLPDDIEPPDLSLPDLSLPDLSLPDQAAIRRAVLWGVFRAGLAAVAVLLLIAATAAVSWVGAGALRAPRFARVALHGVQSAHPEYEITQGLFSNLGDSTMELRLRPRGQFGHTGLVIGHARQPVLGALQLELGEPTKTPILQAMLHAPAAKTDTLAYLNRLPDVVSASALVEFATPLTPDAFTALAALHHMEDQFSAVFLTPLYSSGPTVSWPTGLDLGGCLAWADSLEPGDDADLARLGLPPAADLQNIARNPRIYAVVVERAPMSRLRALLGSPTVQSLNVVDVGFNTADQFPIR